MPAEQKNIFLKSLPEGINYPDDDPYILYLKGKSPNIIWDRYIPTEVAKARLMQNGKASDESKFDFPAGCWVYNGTWEYEWEDEDEEVKAKFTGRQVP